MSRRQWGDNEKLVPLFGKKGTKQRGPGKGEFPGEKLDSTGANKRRHPFFTIKREHLKKERLLSRKIAGDTKVYGKRERTKHF